MFWFSAHSVLLCFLAGNTKTLDSISSLNATPGNHNHAPRLGKCVCEQDAVAMTQVMMVVMLGCMKIE